MTATGRPPTSPLSLAFLGLATSHPYTDARTVLRTWPEARLHVWEGDPARLAEFVSEHPGATVHADPESLVAAPVDGVVVSVRPREVSSAINLLAALEVPVFVNKPAAATREQLAAVDAAVARVRGDLLSCSVLRFAQRVQELRDRVSCEEVLTAHVVARHDVGRWQRGSTPWQDDPDDGGGAVVTIGLHGIEVLSVLLGCPERVTFAVSGRRHYHGLRSEDVAQIGLAWTDGTLAGVDVIGVAEEEGYDVVIETRNGPLAVRLRPDDGPDPFGYEATLTAFLTMVQARKRGDAVVPAVAWSETRRILALAAEAATLAR